MFALPSYLGQRGRGEKQLTFEPAIARGFILHFLIHPNYTCWVVSILPRILPSLRCGFGLWFVFILFQMVWPQLASTFSRNKDPPPETSISQIKENVNRKKEGKKRMSLWKCQDFVWIVKSFLLQVVSWLMWSCWDTLWVVFCSTKSADPSRRDW